MADATVNKPTKVNQPGKPFEEIVECGKQTPEDSRALMIVDGRPPELSFVKPDELKSLMEENRDLLPPTVRQYNDYFVKRMEDEGYNSICRIDAPHNEVMLLASKTPPTPKDIFNKCDQATTVPRRPLPISLSPEEAQYLASRLFTKSDACSEVGKDGAVMYKFLTEPASIKMLVDNIQKDIDKKQLPKGVTEERAKYIIDGLKIIAASDPFTKQSDSTKLQLILMSIGSVLGVAGTLIGAGSLLYVRKQVGLFEKQMVMMQKMMEVQMKTFESMSAKPKIEDVANDVVEEVRREIAEDLTEPFKRDLELVRRMRERTSSPKIEISLRHPTRIVKSWLAIKKWEEKVRELATPNELAAQARINAMLTDGREDAAALKLLSELAENLNHKALVNRGNINVGRQIAERAAYLIASGDPRVPAVVRETGVWWETKPNFDIVGRRELVLSMIGTLTQGELQNIFLMAPTGAGKKQAVRALALFIVRDDPDLSEELKGKEIWRIDNDKLQEDTKLRGTPNDRRRPLWDKMQQGHMLSAEEAAKMMTSGLAEGAPSESFAVSLLTQTTNSWSRVVFDGKEGDYEAVTKRVANLEGQHDFDRRFTPLTMRHLTPSEIVQSLSGQWRTDRQAKDNCEIPDATVEAAVRLGISYRNARNSAPFDPAKNALSKAVVLARREQRDKSVKIAVMPQHVVRALQDVLKPFGVDVDPDAGKGMFDDPARDHTEHPFARKEVGSGQAAAGDPKVLARAFRDHPAFEGYFLEEDMGDAQRLEAAKVVIATYEGLRQSEKLGLRRMAFEGRDTVIAGYPVRFIMHALEMDAKRREGAHEAGAGAGASTEETGRTPGRGGRGPAGAPTGPAGASGGAGTSGGQVDHELLARRIVENPVLKKALFPEESIDDDAATSALLGEARKIARKDSRSEPHSGDISAAVLAKAGDGDEIKGELLGIIKSNPGFGVTVTSETASLVSATVAMFGDRLGLRTKRQREDFVGDLIMEASKITFIRREGDITLEHFQTALETMVSDRALLAEIQSALQGGGAAGASTRRAGAWHDAPRRTPHREGGFITLDTLTLPARVAGRSARILAREAKGAGAEVAVGAIPFVMGEMGSELLLNGKGPRLSEVAETYVPIAVGGSIGQRITKAIPKGALGAAEPIARRGIPLFMALTLAEYAKTGRVDLEQMPLAIANIVGASGAVHFTGRLLMRSSWVRRAAQAFRLVKAGAVATAPESGGTTLLGAAIASVAEFYVLKQVGKLEERLMLDTEASSLRRSYADAVKKCNELVERNNKGERVSYLDLIEAEKAFYVSSQRYEQFMQARIEMLEEQRDELRKELNEEEMAELAKPLDGSRARVDIRSEYERKRRELAAEYSRGIGEIENSGREDLRLASLFGANPKVQKADLRMLFADPRNGFKVDPRLERSADSIAVSGRLASNVAIGLEGFKLQRAKFVADYNEYWSKVLSGS